MTVPQQRPLQPWPSTVAQQRAAPPMPRHASPAPVPTAQPVAGDRTWMTVLRATAYVLTSIASLLFIGLVIYAAVTVNQIGDALSGSPFGSTYSSSSYDPDAGTRPAICDTDPSDTACYGG